MRRILFLVFIICISLKGYAQDEFEAKFKPIPPKNMRQKIKKVKPPKKVLPIVKPPNSIAKKDSILPAVVAKDDFINPEELFKDYTLYKKEANVSGIFYRRNQNLGVFKTKSIISKVRYRDAAFVDGDKIKVYLNDKVIQPEVSLEGDFKGFEIKLEKGINKIDFEALNEGFAPPNTAQFEVFDDKGILISGSQWNLGTGYKATIILVKE